MASRRLASWAVGLDSLPPTVGHAAKRSLYNYIGCAIGGSQHPAVQKAHAALSPLFGQGTATLIGSGESARADPQHAALLNGIASHVHDYDDTHLATIIHPTGPIASALLAYAEHCGAVSGERVICALTAGIEASCKLGLAVWPEHYDIGWHITSSTGAIGAAVAVGKLMKLDEDRMAHAIGIAAVQVTGLREMFGSDTKSFHPGRAAQNGLMAAMLAQSGYTSSFEALEARRGWAAVVAGGGTPKLDHYLAELGKKWEIESNSFKPYPCGIVCHPVIDGCIQLHHDMQKRGIESQQVAKVEAHVHPLVLELTSKRTPKDGLEGKFSVYHGAAVGLLYGKAGPAQYSDHIVADPAVISVRDKVDATPDAGLAPDEAYLTIHLVGGGTLQNHIEHSVGSLAVPMTDEQLTGKFIDQSTLVIGSQAKEISDRVWQIADVEDVGLILQSLG